MAPAGDLTMVVGCRAAVGCWSLAVQYRSGLYAMFALPGPRGYLGEAKVLELAVQASDACVSGGATVSPLLGLCPPPTLCVSLDWLLAWGKI